MTTLQADEKTLVHELKSNDPYGWLSGDDSYQLPPEWLAMIADIPKKHSARILASIDADSFARYATYVNPIFADPNHGLLSLAERELIGVVVSSINGCVAAGDRDSRIGVRGVLFTGSSRRRIGGLLETDAG